MAEEESPPLSEAVVRIRGISVPGAVLIVLALGCANDAAVLGVSVTPAAGSQVSFSNDIQRIFSSPSAPRCAYSGCHGGTPLSAPMSLEPGKAYASLVGADACEAPLLKRVEPGKSSTSYLVIKIEGTQSDVFNAGGCAPCPAFEPIGNCGTAMPQGGTPLSTAEKQLIRDWIDQGAKDN